MKLKDFYVYLNLELYFKWNLNKTIKILYRKFNILGNLNVKYLI